MIIIETFQYRNKNLHIEITTNYSIEKNLRKKERKKERKEGRKEGRKKDRK